MTVKDVALIALKLLGRVNNQGVVDENREAKYINLSPSYCNILQRELLREENSVAIPTLISLLTDVFVLNNDTIERVLPFGLARQFAQIDNDPQYGVMVTLYENEKGKINPILLSITDSTGYLSDLDLVG